MPSPTRVLGSGKISSTCSSARIGPPAAMRPTSGTMVGVGEGVADAGRVVVGVVGVGDRAPGGHQLGDEHLEGPRPVGVALDEALLLQHAQLVGDAGGAGQADQLADLADARRVAALLDRLAQHVEDALLPRGQAGAVGGRVGQLGDGAASGAPRAVLLVASRHGSKVVQNGDHFKHMFERRVAVWLALQVSITLPRPRVVTDEVTVAMAADKRVDCKVGHSR